MTFPLPYPVVTDYQGQQLTAEAVQKNFEALAAAVPSTGGKSVEIRFGRSTLTFAASVNSSATVVAHGLGRDPYVVVVQSFGGPAFGQIPNPDVFAHDATNFQMTGELKTAYTGSIPVAWIAIG